MSAALLAAAASEGGRSHRGRWSRWTAYGVPGRLAAPAFAALVGRRGGACGGRSRPGIDGAPYAAGARARLLPRRPGRRARGRVTRARRAGASAPAGGSRAPPPVGRPAGGMRVCGAVAARPGPGLSLVLTAAIAAAVVVLAAGRRSAPRGALEIEGEGPPLNEPSPLAAGSRRFEGLRPRGPTTCGSRCSPARAAGLCKRIAPAADALARGRGATALRRGRATPRRGRPHVSPARPSRSRWAPTAWCWPRERSTTGASSRRSSTRRAAAARDRGGRHRRAFLGRAGGVAATAAGAGMVGAVIRPGEADAYHFCGHIYTTDGLSAPERGCPDRPSRLAAARRATAARSTTSGGLIDPLGRPSTRTASC